MSLAPLVERWRRFLALDRGDRWLIIEALLMLSTVHVGLRTMRFGVLRRLVTNAEAYRSQSPRPASRVGWAINAAAPLLPARSCLNDALAAHVMLTRRGHPSLLRLGVKRGTAGDEAVQAHAWVECDGAIVTGAMDGLDQYHRFPDNVIP
jgi:hypothetical protein